MSPVQTAQELFDAEMAEAGHDPDRLSEHDYGLIQAVTPVLDNLVGSIGEKPEPLRVTAAVLRSYSRMIEQYVAAYEAAQ